MKPQAFKVGGYYWITSHRWAGERRMEFLRRDEHGRLIFALPESSARRGIRFENAFYHSEIVSAHPVDMENDKEEVLLEI